ncbi:hypothetical protein [Paludisphaera rhizosphaerae]|uniref:hypothetical protein n=1 Tax=Paludisphaera rhizosphaerae TaxID=2711216 RepID=UPI0013EB97C6|nr:hypothetical protein [Paludisphaera rhizosphaerae]
MARLEEEKVVAVRLNVEEVAALDSIKARRYPNRCNSSQVVRDLILGAAREIAREVADGR